MASLNPIISTGRLDLTGLIAADAPAFFAYRSHPAVCRYQSFEPGALVEAEAFIAGLGGAEFGTPGGWFQLAVRLRGSARLVGDLGVHFSDDDGRQVEIGFTISPHHQGQGLGGEAVRALLDHLLGALQKHRALASVDPRNVASVALLTRLGMRKEAHFRESLWFKGEWVDDVVFGILGSEWRAPRSGEGA